MRGVIMAIIKQIKQIIDKLEKAHIKDGVNESAEATLARKLSNMSKAEKAVFLKTNLGARKINGELMLKTLMFTNSDNSYFVYEPGINERDNPSILKLLEVMKENNLYDQDSSKFGLIVPSVQYCREVWHSFLDESMIRKMTAKTFIGQEDSVNQILEGEMVYLDSDTLEPLFQKATACGVKINPEIIKKRENEMGAKGFIPKKRAKDSPTRQNLANKLTDIETEGECRNKGKSKTPGARM
jgi:hypothetical protein